ncbi:cation:proton antiporter [Nocardioides mesophilus]|uniref:Cation:proton antiporter n=2 Tax=Nocardioides mesophilus TaxID=433659 RepID=A0A7G9RHS2_9ACTN|nr:cation:proton antiporter [Nocardioides mesophilus]
MGAALFLAVVLPSALHRQAVSAPMVLLVVGGAIGLLPLPEGFRPSPIEHRAFVEHLTEFCVVVALMGVGLALDRPLRLRDRSTWRRWGATWRLLAFAMPLTIGATALLGWWAMGLAPAAALLLGAVLAPTDPVLASDVQVEGPTTLDPDGADEAGVEDDPLESIDEHDEVRFALTSEAGLNDGLAFPFVYAAIALATLGGVGEWGLHWLAWDLVGKVVLGIVVGVAVGTLLAKVAFRGPAPSLRLAETGEPLMALAAVLLSYGVTEVVGGYGFLAVFACAMALRSAERSHEYHVHMHGLVERLERLLTLIVLLLLGVAITNGLLVHLTWQGALVGLLLVFVVRPLSGLVSLRVNRSGPQAGGHVLAPRERTAVAFLGVRGVGSLYYLAYAAGHADFGHLEQLWATVAFTITASVLVHGVAATPVMRRLDAARDRETAAPQAS